MNVTRSIKCLLRSGIKTASDKVQISYICKLMSIFVDNSRQIMLCIFFPIFSIESWIYKKKRSSLHTLSNTQNLLVSQINAGTIPLRWSGENIAATDDLLCFSRKSFENAIIPDIREVLLKWRRYITSFVRIYIYNLLWVLSIVRICMRPIILNRLFS